MADGPFNYAPTFDRFEHATVVTALVHYAMHVHDPSEIVNCLTKLAPETELPWDKIIRDGRSEYRAILDRVDPLHGVSSSYRPV